jgi:hypothetical protein
VLEVPQGLGKHIAVVQSNKPALRQLLKIREIHMCCVTIGSSVVKISVSLLFLRLTARKAYRVFLWGIITFMVGFTTVCVGTIVSNLPLTMTAWLTAMVYQDLPMFSCAGRVGYAFASTTYRKWQREVFQPKCFRSVRAVQLDHQHCYRLSARSPACTTDLKTSNRTSHQDTCRRDSFARSLRLHRRHRQKYV